LTRTGESVPRRVVSKLLETTPYRIARRYGFDLSDQTVEIMKEVRSHTLASPARLAETIRAAEYVCDHGIPGAIVECGVWRGGTMMAVALTLRNRGEVRDLYLFDTFEGMSEPTDRDRMLGTDARPIWEANREGDSNAWTRAGIEEVRAAMTATGYEPSRIRLVKGKVEDTLPAEAPDQISVLRLDTDFYESTRHEMVELFPRLSTGGVLLLDDYGAWEGAKQAVDEYLAEHGIRLFLARTDQTGRAAVKQAPGPPES
jgi:O-methyltransferase